MNVIVNGQQKEFSQISSLNDIIISFAQDSRHIIAEINGTIIKKNHWSQTPIQEGDTIELISFIGGGST